MLGVKHIKLLTILSLVLACFRSSNSEGEEKQIELDRIQKRAVAATVGIKIPNVDDSTSQGTGTIVGRRANKILVVTLAGLFRDHDGKSEVTVRHIGQANDERVGELVHLNRELELALVRVGTSSMTVSNIAPGVERIARGDECFLVSWHQPSAALVANNSHVLAVNQYDGPPNLTAKLSGHGDCYGGSLFNADGQLIGVCWGYDVENPEGVFAPAKSVRVVMNEAKDWWKPDK